MWSSPSLRYPGNYYDRASGKLIAEVRMFIGRCVDSREGVAWFVRNTEGSRAQVDSVLRSQVSFEYVDLDSVPGPYNGWTLLEDLAGRVEISAARAAVNKHNCREIAPKSEIFTDASAYIVRTLRFRTDCSSPALLPSEVPLGPGRPGTRIAYLDGETNTSLHVASDGRQLTAMNSDGKVLWVRDPFSDNNLCPYRSERPIISYMARSVGREVRQKPKGWQRGSATLSRSDSTRRNSVSSISRAEISISQGRIDEHRQACCGISSVRAQLCGIFDVIYLYPLTCVRADAQWIKWPDRFWERRAR